jgi:hypothetical protein
MTREKAREAAAVMLAYAGGKPVEYKDHGDTEWHLPPKDGHLSFDWWKTNYRIKPEPKLRPWKPEEVPLNAWFRSTENGWRHCLLLVTHSAVTLALPGAPDVIAFEMLLQKYEHSIDGGITWQKCGIIE